MAAASVPEAPVNEHSKALAAKDEVRVAGQRLVPPPAGDAGGPENGRQS
jgi:hypothetical protein